MHRLKGGSIEYECDNCRDSLKTDELEFFEAREVMRREGWKALLNAGAAWEHRCKTCAKK
jgi:hypothetical protein